MIFSKKLKKDTVALKNLIYAVIALIIVGTCTILILINPFEKQNKSYDKTIHNISPELFQSQNYTPNDIIENSIKLNKPPLSIKLEVILPVDSSVFIMNEPINFKTKGILQHTYQIIICNNKGEKVFESDEIKDQSYMVESRLNPGIYYWKIQLKNSTIWGGRFFIIHK